MKHVPQTRHETSAELQLAGVVRSMSDWVGLEPLTDAQANRSLAAATPDGDRLAALESTRRFLGVRIEDEQLAGMPTANLEQALEATRAETRSLLVHLQADANGQP